jgi:uncharacterized protein
MFLLGSLLAPVESVAGHLTQALGLDPETGAGAAVSFFAYELVKVSLLILAISWLMALVRRALPVEAMRRWLATPLGRIFGYPAAAAFGAVTPFCSCSSVPLFIGFIEARLPVGIALAFLITSPLVNEIVVALFIASFGWKVALLYVVSGLVLGMAGGWWLQRLGAERWLTAFARREAAAGPARREATIVLNPVAAPAVLAATSSGHSGIEAPPPPGGLAPDSDAASAPGACGCGPTPCSPPRLTSWAFANQEARDIYLGVLPYLAAALVVGALIHGFVPEQFFSTYFGGGRWWDVPSAVLLGFPLYASANATVPILETLVAKGVPLGTGMAFIMSAVGVSVPELMILKRVMTFRLLLAFGATVSGGVMLVGWLFNAVF